MDHSAQKTPLVAIVTPVYNGAKFLAECMDSVQAQTYPNIVHIVVDNASTDATATILERYAQGTVPVTIRRNAETLCIGANWNLAVTLVPPAAKYFRILCADDLIHPEFVARTVAVAEDFPSVVVVGCRLHHRGDQQQVVGWEQDRRVFPGKEAIQRFLKGGVTIIAHQTLIRRTELERRSPFFDEGMAAYDTDACLDMLTRGDWGFVHDILATTRDHADTHTNRFVRNTRIAEYENLVLTERYAEFAFGRDASRLLVRKYRRHYLRQLIRWRARGERATFEQHIAKLRRFGALTLLWFWIDAIIDWPIQRLRRR